jgi:threonine-phosphate decarboxylase
VDPVPIPMGVHGGNTLAVAAALGVDPAEILDLSASMSPVAPDAAAVVAGLPATAVRAYPDTERATTALAGAIGVRRDRLLLTNGGAEAIALLAAEHPRGRVEEPAFSLYRRHLATGDDPHGLVWRTNPSSPLGRFAAPDDAADVWDEAYWALATGTWTRGDEEAYRLGSLTKLWACPGLRLGYVIAPTSRQRDALAERQPRWAVNGLATAAVPHLLELTDLPRWAGEIASLRAATATMWRERGFEVAESAANWVLVHDAAWLREPLARELVLVRDCASFGLPGTIRVAVPGERDGERLAAALDRALDAADAARVSRGAGA